MTLQSTFEDYTAILSDNKKCESGEDGRLYILPGRMHKIRALVEKCEQTLEFRNLVKKTRANYANCPDREDYDIWHTSPKISEFRLRRIDLCLW